MTDHAFSLVVSDDVSKRFQVYLSRLAKLNSRASNVLDVLDHKLLHKIYKQTLNNGLAVLKF